MKTNHSAFTIVCIAAIISWTAPETGAQLVANGGFESGTFAPDWIVTDSSLFSDVGANPLFAHSGTYHANLGATGTIGSLLQTIDTTVGTSYTLSFFLANDGGVPPNFFQALFNGVPLLTLTDAPGFGYTNFFATFTGIGLPAPLEFRYQNDQDFFRLDDVSVNVVPEPSTTTLLALPIFAWLLFLRSRSRGRKNSLS